MTSSTSPGSTFARWSAALMATAPRSCAGVLANAPLNDPTGVLAADAITISVMARSPHMVAHETISDRSVGACCDVMARRWLDLLKLCIAERCACRDLLAGLGSQPRLPIRPPAPGYLARGLQPALWPLVPLAAVPEAALVARRRIDDARNVSARRKREPDVTRNHSGRAVGALPRNDVVLAAFEHGGGNVDLHKIDRGRALRGLSGEAQVVFEIGVAHVPAIHRPGQVGAVGVPIQDIECVRLPPFEIVAHDVGPDQVIAAQCRKDEGDFPTGHDPAVSDHLPARGHAGVVDQQTDLAGLAEVEHRGEERQACELVLAARRKHGRRAAEPRTA